MFELKDISMRSFYDGHQEKETDLRRIIIPIVINTYLVILSLCKNGTH